MRWILISLLLLLGAAPAAAQNGSAPGTLELYPTFQCVGARLPYIGDANGNATARLEWRRAGDAAWTPGVAMSRITNARWAGSVLWLSPDTPYEVRAVIQDPDGGAIVTGTVRTRRLLPSSPTGRTWWVASNGNDASAGTASAPLATLQAAATRAQPGEEIRVRPGIYYQTLDTPRSGTATAPIHLVGDAPGVIVDGSDPALLRRTDWRSDGGGVFSIPYTALASNRLVCVDSLQRLYKQASLAALQSNANGMPQGFAIEGGRLYLKLEDGSSPVTHVVHVARFNLGLILDSSYWRVSGLEVRYFGTGAGGAGIYLSGGGGSWIADNHVHTMGGRGILMRNLTADNLIERNLVRDPRVGVWPWSATKAHDEEITAISNRGGRGNVIRYNTVTGWFDGMDANDGTPDENIAADADYHGNLVTGCGDDAIETDTVSGINLRLWGERYTGNYSGISIGPIYQGPEYVLFNVVANYARSGFKFALTSIGHAWLCHNTLSTSVAGKPVVWPSGPYSNIHFRNNVMVGNAAPTVSDDAGESQTGNDFDGDLLHTPGSGTLFRWKDANYGTLGALRSATGFEAVGRTGDPLFTAATTGDYTLRLGSPAIDAGIRLPGINDRFTGTAPDLGAFETGGGNDAAAPASIRDLR
jgi:parallel beta helix pectate lyase-like protein